MINTDTIREGLDRGEFFLTLPTVSLCRRSVCGAEVGLWRRPSGSSSQTSSFISWKELTFRECSPTVLETVAKELATGCAHKERTSASMYRRKSWDAADWNMLQRKPDIGHPEPNHRRGTGAGFRTTWPLPLRSSVPIGRPRALDDVTLSGRTRDPVSLYPGHHQDRPFARRPDYARMPNVGSAPVGLASGDESISDRRGSRKGQTRPRPCERQGFRWAQGYTLPHFSRAIEGVLCQGSQSWRCIELSGGLHRATGDPDSAGREMRRHGSNQMASRSLLRSVSTEVDLKSTT